MTEYRKLSGTEIMLLKPDDWVAWREERWKPIDAATKWVAAQLMEPPIRCHQVVFVQLGGARTSVEKNRLYKPPEVVGMEKCTGSGITIREALNECEV